MPRLLQLSDLHVVAPGTMASGVLDTPALLRNAIDAIVKQRGGIEPLDAVLVTGDISDDGTAESYIEARAQLERLDLPLLLIPGNHDHRDTMRSAFADLSLMPKEGPVDWATDLGTTRIVGLDSLVEGQGAGRLSETTLSHLRDSLADFHGDSVVVALHHPPLLTGIRFMDDIRLENVVELAAILAPFNGELLVVAGHVHGVHLGRVGGHPVVTAPSICSAFALDRRSDAPVGFNTGPTGYAVIDTVKDGLWSAVPLEPFDGPHAF